MSKYTTELRFICENAVGLTESKGYNNINEIIAGAIPNIFNFNFPIFDEAYRTVLETKILKHFYTREISEETVGLWKLRLDTKMNEIMPYYNKLYESELIEFNPLYTYNLTRTTSTNANSNTSTSNNGSVNTTNGGTVTESGNITNGGTDLYSDTPQGSLTGVLNETYLTNARKTSDTTNSTNTTTNNLTTNVTSNDSGSTGIISTESYLENVSGYNSSNGSDLLLKYRETFLNIDMLIINELEVLFFQLW